MKKILIPAIVAVLIAAILVPILVFSGDEEEEKPEANQVTQEGSVMVSEYGDATLDLPTTISMPLMKDIYREAIVREGEDVFKEKYAQGIIDEYKILTGLDLEVTESEIDDVDGDINIIVHTYAPQFGVYNYDRELWEITVSPPDKENAIAIEYIVTQTMFAQMMLKDEPGTQELEIVSEIPIVLPENTDILNKENLSASSWKIDFGGGTFRESSISVDEDKGEVILTERIVVTEQAPRLLKEEKTGYDMYDYRDFVIEYNFPADFSENTMNELGLASASEGNCESLDDFRWSKGIEFSHEFTADFEAHEDGVDANLSVTANPSFGFEFYIGWDFDWAWDIPPWELDWFRTYAEFSPAFYMDLVSDITGNFGEDFGGEELSWSWPFSVTLGPIPVVIDVRLDITPGVNVSAQGELHLDAMVDASATLKLGVEYDSGWDPILEEDYTHVLHGPNILTGAEASLNPYAQFKLGAYFYSSLGPYVSLTPNVEANLRHDPDEWSIVLAFDIGAGIGFGELGDWLGLDDWEFADYRWSETLDEGTWDNDNTPPSLELVTSPVPEGSTDDTYTYEARYADADGDEPAYVRCFIDGSPNDMDLVSGDFTTGALYRYVWEPTSDDVGSHTYYFEAKDAQAMARVPRDGVLHGPTLTLPWIAISAASEYSTGLREDGTLWVWGGGIDQHFDFRAGYEYRTIPNRVSRSSWNSISAKKDHGLCLASNGFMRIYYYTGDSWEVPSLRWRKISAGEDHFLAIDNQGRLWAWGSNDHGQLGTGDTAYGLDPVQVGTSSDWTAISAGDTYSLALRSDGTLWGWGNNLYGQIGTGDNLDKLTPTRIGTAINWWKISAGDTHALGIQSDGTLWAWGSNSGGLLGVGEGVDVLYTPTRLGKASNWEEISAGRWHSLALRSDGTLWAWGHNEWGELGLGDTTQRNMPYQVGTSNDWMAISAGYSHSLAIRTDKTLWGWGNNDYGQLGVGDTDGRTTPAMITN